MRKDIAGAFKNILTPVFILNDRFRILYANDSAKDLIIGSGHGGNMKNISDILETGAYKRLLSNGTVEKLHFKNKNGLYTRALALAYEQKDEGTRIFVIAPEVLQLDMKEEPRFFADNYSERAKNDGLLKEFISVLCNQIYGFCKEDRYIELLKAEDLCRKVLKQTWNGKDLPNAPVKIAIVKVVERIAKSLKGDGMNISPVFDFYDLYDGDGTFKIDIDLFTVAFLYLANFFKSISGNGITAMNVLYENSHIEIRLSCVCKAKGLSEVYLSESFSNLASAFSEQYLDLLFGSIYASVFGYEPCYSVRDHKGEKLFEMMLRLPVSKDGIYFENVQDILDSEEDWTLSPGSVTEQLLDLVLKSYEDRKGAE